MNIKLHNTGGGKLKRVDDLAIIGSGQNKHLERRIPVHSANRDSAKKAERARALNLALSFI